MATWSVLHSELAFLSTLCVGFFVSPQLFPVANVKIHFFKSRSLALTPEMCSFDVSSDVFHVMLCGINIRDDIIKWSLWSPVLCFTE